MKFSLIKNDKTTFIDEIILGLICIACLVSGILLIICLPSFGILGSSSTGVIGVLLAIIGFMLLPSLIYRLFTNNRRR